MGAEVKRRETTLLCGLFLKNIHFIVKRDPIIEDICFHQGTLAEEVNVLAAHCQMPAIGCGSQGSTNQAAHISTPQPYSVKMNKVGKHLPFKVTHLR